MCKAVANVFNFSRFSGRISEGLLACFFLTTKKEVVQRVEYYIWDCSYLAWKLVWQSFFFPQKREPELGSIFEVGLRVPIGKLLLLI